MSKCYTITSITIVIIIIAIYCGLAVASGFVANQSDSDTCIGSYEGIKFDYITWLKVFCIITLGIVGSSIFLLLLVFATLDPGVEIMDTDIGVIVSLLARLGIIFEFCWYIVGSILYFKTVHKNCQNDTIIFKFGDALFVIQTITIVSFCVIGYSSNKIEDRQILPHNNENDS